MEGYNNIHAFPQHEDATRTDDMPQKGMTMLDYFAAKALQSYMLNCEAFKVNDGYIAAISIPELARCSYEIAKAMVAERSKHL